MGQNKLYFYIFVIPFVLLRLTFMDPGLGSSTLLCIVGELAGGGSVAVTVGVSDR